VALAWVGSWLNTLALGLLVYPILVFPTGRLLSDRWRLVAWLYVGWTVSLTLATALKPGPFEAVATISNPIYVEGAAGAFATLVVSAGEPVNLLFTAAFAASVILRFRRATGEERQQLKWFAYAIALMIVWWSIFTLLQWSGVLTLLQRWQGPAVDLAVDTLWGLAFAGIPVAVGIAILKYRLWDIDLFINRTLLYGALLAVMIGLYILVVGGLGVVFQASGNLLLSVLATGLIALLFHPLRVRLQRWINRLLYGQRDEPYAVLSRLGQRLEATLAPGAVLPAIVDTVREALKLPYAALSIKQGDVFTITASAGRASEELMRLPLVYQHDPIGQLLVAPRAPGEALTPTDLRLLNDLARQAGVAAHAVRLTTDLQRLMVDLQRSRERLVTAREEERRRLRRDLHDGLGPTLGALMLQVGSARALLTHDPAAERLLNTLEVTLEGVIVDIRRLVYNLRPPALDELGLVAAIRDHVAQYGVQGMAVEQAGTAPGLYITVEAPERLPELAAAVEVAAYRIVAEALANVVRHAQARTCRIRLKMAEALYLEIDDDGVGLPSVRPAGVGLRSMRERAEELGGACLVNAAPAGGTRVWARLPLPAEGDAQGGEAPPEGDQLEASAMVGKEAVR
jgi:signal transduction histidine kinase